MAQSRQDKPLQKVEQLEKVKLIEFLNLNDETSVKLLSRRKDFKEKSRSYYHAMDSLVAQLESFDGKSDKQNPAIKKCIEEYQRLEMQVIKNRQEFINSLYEILTPEQVGKYIVFEKKFKKEIQDFIFKSREKNHKSE
jgi:Spy/CpxP family protein refolding chaperone